MVSTALAAALVLPVAPPATAGELTNLSLGADYQVSVGWPDDGDEATQQEQYPDSGGELTDGEFAEVDYTSPGWVGFLKQTSRSITIDLGRVTTVRKLSTDFLFNHGAGVDLPATVDYALSLNGQTFRTVASPAGDNVGTVNESRAVEARIRPTLARYLQVTFDVATWGFVDEITALGERHPTPGAQPPRGPIDEGVRDSCQADPAYLEQGTPEVNGVQNAFLAYTYDSTGESGEVGTWREDTLLPVITHTDADGKPDDWLFDTVLFMAGGSELDAYPTRAGWEDLLNRLFEPGQNVDALDTVTASAAAELDAPDRRTKLMLPIPNPVPTHDKPWGTIDGRELDLNPERVGEETSAANRRAVADWYIAQVMDRLEQLGSDHLDLVGFYWMREAIAPNSSDSALSNRISDTVHSLPGDLKLYWIPYYQAAGYQHWRSYGFDASMMQPNYFFNDDLPAGDDSRLLSTTELARCTGQGLEIEGDQAMLTDADAREKFLQYLDVYQRTGGDQALKSYYWGTRDTFIGTVDSADPEVRGAYDAVHDFIAESR